MTAINKPRLKPETKLEKRLSKPRKKVVETGDGLGWNWIVENIPYLVFVTILGLIYILNSRSAEKVFSDVSHLNKEVEELRWDYVTKKANAEKLTSKTNLISLINKKKLGLKAFNEPPQKMKLD